MMSSVYAEIMCVVWPIRMAGCTADNRTLRAKAPGPAQTTEETVGNPAVCLFKPGTPPRYVALYGPLPWGPCTGA